MTALKAIILATVLAFVGSTRVVAAQMGQPAQNSPVAPNLQIVVPRNGQKLTVDYVNVQFQVTNPAAAANNIPTFQMSLDGGNPIQTSSTTHTFTGLTPGEHSVSVEVVDANGTPVPGTRAEVHFVVTPQVNAPAQSPPRAGVQGSPSRDGVVSQASSQTASAQADLPSAASGLPLLSIIGFGVLVGGIASALRTR